MSKVYVPSTTPGKSWSIFVNKQPGRPAYAGAIEGTLESGGESGFQSFSFMMFQARTINVPLNGNNTAKNRAVALSTLRQKLLDAGAITPDAPAFY